MPKRDWAHIIYAEPKDIARAEEIVVKINRCIPSEKGGYNNYLNLREGALVFILN